jgi:hypothetical protein
MTDEDKLRCPADLNSFDCKLVIADAYPPAEVFYKKNGWVKPNSTLLAKRIEADKGCQGKIYAKRKNGI